MKGRVVVAGGGVASIEAALALRDLAGETAQVDLFSPRRDFVYRPYAVGEPYGRAQVAHYDLEQLAALCGAGFHRDAISSVDTEARVAVTFEGEHVPYDHLILARPLPHLRLRRSLAGRGRGAGRRGEPGLADPAAGRRPRPDRPGAVPGPGGRLGRAGDRDHGADPRAPRRLPRRAADHRGLRACPGGADRLQLLGDRDRRAAPRERDHARRRPPDRQLGGRPDAAGNPPRPRSGGRDLLRLEKPHARNRRFPDAVRAAEGETRPMSATERGEG